MTDSVLRSDHYSLLHIDEDANLLIQDGERHDFRIWTRINNRDRKGVFKCRSHIICTVVVDRDVDNYSHLSVWILTRELKLLRLWEHDLLLVNIMEHVGRWRVRIRSEDDLDGVLAVGDLHPGVGPGDFSLANGDYRVFGRRDENVIESARVDEDLEFVLDRFHQDEGVVVLQDDLDIVLSNLVLQALHFDRVVSSDQICGQAQICKEIDKLKHAEIWTGSNMQRYGQAQEGEVFLERDSRFTAILAVQFSDKVILVYHNLFVGCSAN